MFGIPAVRQAVVHLHGHDIAEQRDGEDRQLPIVHPKGVGSMAYRHRISRLSLMGATGRGHARRVVGGKMGAAEELAAQSATVKYEVNDRLQEMRHATSSGDWLWRLNVAPMKGMNGLSRLGIPYSVGWAIPIVAPDTSDRS